MDTEKQTVTGLLSQVAEIITATDAAAAKFLAKAQGAYNAAGYVSWGVVLLGFVLLVIYETAQSDRGPRVGFILMKLGIIVVLLLEYGLVVRVITGLAGGGDWGQSDELLGWASGVGDLLLTKYDGISSIPMFLFWALLVGILLIASLIAYVVAVAISLSQGVLIAIALSLGKLAISVSIAPGVSMERSWAKFLAMVAAWSTIGAAVVSLMQVTQGQVHDAIAAGDELAVLKVAGRYIVLAFALGSTPWITAAIFNGVAAMAPGISQPLAIGRALLRSPAQAVGRAASGAVKAGGKKALGAAGGAVGSAWSGGKDRVAGGGHSSTRIEAGGDRVHKTHSVVSTVQSVAPPNSGAPVVPVSQGVSASAPDKGRATSQPDRAAGNESTHRTNHTSTPAGGAGGNQPNESGRATSRSSHSESTVDRRSHSSAETSGHAAQRSVHESHEGDRVRTQPSSSAKSGPEARQESAGIARAALASKERVHSTDGVRTEPARGQSLSAPSTIAPASSSSSSTPPAPSPGQNATAEKRNGTEPPVRPTREAKPRPEASKSPIPRIHKTKEPK